MVEEERHAGGHAVWLDGDAAGWGWFVDRTPRDDREFTTPGDQGERCRVNLLGVYHGVRSFVPVMLAGEEPGVGQGPDQRADRVRREPEGLGRLPHADARLAVDQVE